MFFTRTHTYHFPISREDLKTRLIGKHVKIHDLDFEVVDDGGTLSIIPHAEQVNAIKTLPITTITMNESNGKTKVAVTSRMRPIDSGGPFLIVIFCAFMLIAAGILIKVDENGDRTIPYTLLGISLLIMAIFSIRMQMGYFDYIRKVRQYVKEKGSPASFANMSVA